MSLDSLSSQPEDSQLQASIKDIYTRYETLEREFTEKFKGKIDLQPHEVLKLAFLIENDFRKAHFKKQKMASEYLGEELTKLPVALEYYKDRNVIIIIPQEELYAGSQKHIKVCAQVSLESPLAPLDKVVRAATRSYPLDSVSGKPRPITPYEMACNKQEIALLRECSDYPDSWSPVVKLLSVRNFLKTIRGDEGDISIEKSVAIYDYYEGSLFSLLLDLQKIEESGRSTINSRLKMAEDILNGVDFIHSKGIVHGDIKPENYLYKEVNGEFRLCLCDFGHGYKKDAESTKLPPNSYLARCLYGSFKYSAPELILPNRYSALDGAKIDTWAAGCILFLLAFPGKDPPWMELLKDVRTVDQLHDYRLVAQFVDILKAVRAQWMRPLLIKEKTGKPQPLTKNEALALLSYKMLINRIDIKEAKEELKKIV